MIGFVGLSHLGILSSIAAASKGFEVIAYDPNPALCNDLNNEKLPIYEPDLDDLLNKSRSNIRFSSNIADLSKCQLIVFSTDVKTDENNRSDLSNLMNLIDGTIETGLENTVLVVLSQVHPGFTRQLHSKLNSILQKRNIQLFYQVETLIFGRAVERALYPERFIVGCNDPAEPLPSVYNDLLKSFGCPVLPMRYESAELAKISINCCLVASVSTANTLAEICEKIGADWSEIVPALRLDRRIGQYSYITPGLGISGGNLERDLHSVLLLAEDHNTDGGVISSWLNNSKRRKNWPYNILKEIILNKIPEASIAVLGLAYKENTQSTKNSPALLLIEQLSTCKIKAYDPIVEACAVGNLVSRTSSALDAANGADALAIMTPWPEFRNIVPSDLAVAMRGCTVIDPYGILDAQKVRSAGLDYYTLGKPPALACLMPDDVMEAIC